MNRLLLGALAGIAGTAAMTVAMRVLHRRLPAPERYPLPPREIVEGVMPPPAAETVGEQPRRDLTMTAHFGYGAATGAALALAVSRPGPGAGAAYGVMIWALSYLGWIPAAGILRPATQHPLRRNALMLGVHLVWGATTALTMRELAAAEEEIFSGGDAKDAATSSYRPGNHSASAR